MKKIYKIACSAALSGVEKLHGEAELKAVRIAIAEAKKQNLPFDIELVWGDDGADKKVSENLSISFCSDPLIMGVVGPMGSNAAVGGASVYNKGNLAHITHSASLVELSKKGYKTFHRIIANDEFQSDILVKFAKQYLKVNNFVIVNDDTSFAEGLCNLMEDQANKYDLKLLSRVLIDSDNSNVSKQVEKIKEINPELVFFAGMEPECNKVAVMLRKAGVKSLYLGTDAIKPSKYLVTPGFYDVDGPYQSNACVDIETYEPAKNFKDAYYKAYGEVYSVYTAEAYDASKIIIEAMRMCGDNVNRLDVLKNIKGLDNYIGASGDISFCENGELKSPKIGFYKFNREQIEFIGLSSNIL